MVRGWLDGAGITVRVLHAALTPDHFADGCVPDERRLRDRLAGVGLTWDTIEAVADICFTDEPQAVTDQRLEEPRAVWRTATSRPTVIGADGEPAVPARELLQAQGRAIEALEELNRVRKAYEASERARNQSLQVATVLFALLGQTQAQVADLSRRLEALQEAPETLNGEISSAHGQLLRATTQQADLRTQLSRAEADRQRAQALADVAARRIQLLESELRGFRKVDASAVGPPETALLPTQLGGDTDAVSELDRVDATLQKARAVLDREHMMVDEVATELGAGDNSGTEAAMMSPFAAGMVATAGAEARTGQGLFRTTRDNAGSPGNELAVRYGDRMRFVGAATRRISRGIDLDEIMMGLCRATVPTFADTILIYLRDPLPAGEERLSGPILLRLARTEEAPFHASIVGTTPWDPPLAAPPHVPVAAAGTCGVRAGGALAHVLRGVRPVLGDGAGREALEELLSKDFDMPGGCRSLLAPLRGRRRVVGVAVFLRRRERLAFEEEDLLAAGQLATQTALGIDKAALYGREAYIADELQRSMLPESLPHVAGIHLASRYLPAAETIRVGGDWYDAILLPRGRVALVVGDVMGHSMRSAAIMGQLRTSVQTLAGLGLPPHELLQQLDDQAMRLGSDRVATCLYAVYDPVSHRIAIASAGHPPPILLHPGGRAEVLDVPPGAPIGVGAADFGVDFETVELGVPADSTLLLYTDGLVESRHKDIWTGIEQVRKQAAATAQPSSLRSVPEVEILCDDLLDLLGPGERDDDIALLAAQLLGITESDAAHWSLDNTVTAPRDARRLVRQVLERWGLHGLVGDAELLVSELVTNSVNATSMLVEPIEVSLLRTHVLRCEVRDRSLDLPSRRRAQPMDEFGRGLRVIQDLAQRWGVSRLVGSKVVWFEIELDWAD